MVNAGDMTTAETKPNNSHELSTNFFQKHQRKENEMFFKKDEKKPEVQSTHQSEAKLAEVQAKPEKKVKPKIKVIYRIEDKSGQGDWTIIRAEVPREQQLGINEFPKILAAQKAVYEDISFRLKKLKEVRTRVKAIRKAIIAGEASA